MKREGSLAARDLADLALELYERRFSGLLILSNGGIGKNLILQAGRMVFASSTSADDRLGELLLRRGRISLRQYVAAGAALSPGKRLGAVLVEQGVLDPKDLVKTVVEQVQEIIYGAFQWTEGYYRLHEGATSAESITLNISTPDIILEGIRRIEAWSRIERAVGGPGARYERAPDYEAALGAMNLSFEKLALLTSLNGTRTVEALCEESSLPDFEVCRTLWAFRVLGLVRRVDAAAASSQAPMADDGLDLVLPE
ncbi:MAG TPA: DUF4388 domain-containing protein [Vicinamibacteria bacterium]|nr:DUF4388 domain-containing protein [Vicinamibacteria bacterium]